MAKRDPNRIQVDLKLLQDRNLRGLHEFSDSFSRSVDRLAGVLERGGGGFGGGGGRGGPARRSREGDDEASTAPLPAMPGGPAGRTPGGGGAAGGNWFSNLIARQGYGNPNITEFERSQFNLGNIGGMDALAQLRYLSHIAQRFGYQEQVDDDGNKYYAPRPGVFGAASRNFGGLLGGAPRAGTYFQSAQGVAGQLYNYNVGPSMFGQNLGLSRDGSMGTGFFSPAWNAGFGANVRALWRSKFGFSPNYSTAQAKEATQTVNQYGYDGHLSNRMLDLMKNVTVHTGLDAATQMQLYDPAMRFGTDSMQGVVDALYQMPAAARAARMGLNQFASDLLSSAQSLAEGGNMTMAGATSGLTQFSAATGLAPSKGAGILNDQRNLWMTSAMTGKNLYQLTFGTHATSDRTQTALRMAEQMMGVPMSDWHRLAKDNPGEYQARMSNMIAVQMADPSLFGGLNIKDLVNLANNPNRVNRMRAGETLARAMEHGGQPNWEALMRQMGASEGIKSHFRDYQLKLQGENLTPHEQKKREQAYLQKVLATLERNSHENARAKTYFDLTPDAKRMLRFMDKTQSKPTSNAGGDARSYSATAVEQRGYTRHLPGT